MQREAPGEEEAAERERSGQVLRQASERTAGGRECRHHPEQRAEPEAGQMGEDVRVLAGRARLAE